MDQIAQRKSNDTGIYKKRVRDLEAENKNLKAQIASLQQSQ
jgi:hypothetical protein